MPRKKPFSGKKKKQQLQAKRDRRRAESFDDGDGAADAGDGPSTDGRPAVTLTTSMGKQGRVNAFSTVFAKETREAIEARRALSTVPLDMARREHELCAWPMTNDPLLAHPRALLNRLKPTSTSSRPSGTASSAYLTASSAAEGEAIEKMENERFEQWIATVYKKYARQQLNSFEHNVEVWRQLWRVTSAADVVVIVADIRNPLYHIPRSLYEEVTLTMGKPLVVCLNKVDLVPADVVERWVVWLQAAFPSGTVFVPFSASGAVLQGLTKLAPRRKEILASRRAKSRDYQDRRLECCRALLEACGALSALPGVEHNIRHGKGSPHDGSDSDSDSTDGTSRTPHDEVHTGPAGEHDEGRPAGDHTDEEKGQDRDRGKGRRKGKGKEKGKGKGKTNGGAGVPNHGEGSKRLSAREMREMERLKELKRLAGGSSHEEGADDGDAAGSGDRKTDGGEGEAAAEATTGSDPRAAGSVGEVAAGAAPASEHAPAPVVVGMVGHPNVGKSSIINTLCGEKRVSVSRTPGHTKWMQTVHVAPGLDVLDCPGLVFPYAFDLPAETATRRRPRFPPAAIPDALIGADLETVGESSALSGSDHESDSVSLASSEASADSDGEGDSGVDSSGGAAAGVHAGSGPPAAGGGGFAAAGGGAGAGAGAGAAGGMSARLASAAASHLSEDEPEIVRAARAKYGGKESLETQIAMQECCGVLPLSQVREPYSAIRLIAEQLPLESLYGLRLPDDEEEWSPYVLCEAYAVKRGYRSRGGRPDTHRAGREILQHSVDGVVPFYFVPPEP